MAKAVKWVPPITFRLYQSIRFNRPIDKDKDYISPGGYELEMTDEDGKTRSVQFDFEEYEGGIDDEDPCVLNCVQKNPDFDSFEGLETVTKHMLKNVTKIVEWYIYTGEEGESDLKPVEILKPTFELISDSTGADLPMEQIKIRDSFKITEDFVPEE